MPTLRTALQVTAAAAALFAASASHAALVFDQNVTPGVIFGNGNANGGYTVNANAANSGIELALRAKVRHDPVTGQPANVFNSNGDGTYSFAPGAWTGAGGSPTTAYWSVEFSINVNASGGTGLALNQLTYAFGIDTDASLATSFTSFDVINAINPGSPGFGSLWWDHALGNNSTVQCNNANNNAGCYGVRNTSANAADYQARIAELNVAQNSQKANWLLGPGFDPNANGTYDFFLAAFRDGQEVGRTSIQVIVGTGGDGTPVSAPGTLALAGLALLGLAGLQRRRRA